MAEWYDAVRVLARRGDNLRSATPRQAGAVAGWLNALIKDAFEHELGLDAGGGLIRQTRIALLDWLFGAADYDTMRYGARIQSARDLTFAEASAVLDWLQAGQALRDVRRWITEHAGELALPRTGRLL